MVHLVRREPLNLFDDLFSDFFQRAVPASRSSDPATAVRARMDVIDQGDRYTVRVLLPGLSQQDIHVSVEGARLTITAEVRRGQEIKEGERVLHTERTATSYARHFELPSEVTEEGADARFEQGVLTLTLPKRAALAGRRLTVN
mgnify:CR=1 FL=1